MTSPQVLVIDDDHNLADICATVFRTAGLTVETIVDSQIALKSLKQIQPKMILLDLHMPGISGEIILEEIKADTRLAETIIVVTTADMVLIEQLQSQVDHTLPKPFKIGQLRKLADVLLAEVS